MKQNKHFYKNEFYLQNIFNKKSKKNIFGRMARF